MKKRIRPLKTITEGLNSVKTLLNVVKTLNSGQGLQSSYSSQHFDTYRNFLMKEITSRGLKSTIQLAKQLQRIGTGIALGIDFTPLPWRKVIPGTKIPMVLKPLVPLLQGTTSDKRLALSVLMAYRLIHLPIEIDTSAITAPISKPLGSLEDKFRLFVKQSDLFSHGPIKPDRKKQHDNLGFLSSKNGPNGQAVLNAHFDAFALFPEEELKASIQWLLDYTLPEIGNSFRTVMGDIKTKELKISRPVLHSKISTISEGGGKMRNIAIVDYWTQNSLIWLHDQVMSLLKRWKSDSTYSQSDGFKRVISLANERKYNASFDLSSATDRFPIQLQKIVVSHIFGEEFATHWETVISKRVFAIPQTQDKVRWEVGQPLGALSSWGVFALTHHLVIKYCAGSHTFTDYQILGDDVCIFNEGVADAYKKFMEDCSVRINLDKSLVSQSPHRVYGEFAKRIFLNSEEITGLPPKILIEARNSVYQISPLLRFLRDRWDIHILGSELYAPELFTYLTSKGKFLLSIILGTQRAMEARVAGYPWCLFGIDGHTLLQAYNKRAILSMNDKINNIFEVGSEPCDKLIFARITTPLEHAEGKPVSESVLGWIYGLSHPIGLAKMKAMVVLSNVQCDLPDSETPIDVIPVDYIPDPLLGSIFSDRKTSRNVSQGKLILKMFYEELSRVKA